MDKIDILCNQTINIALVVKETKTLIDNSHLSNYPKRFIDRINSILQYCYCLFINVSDDKHTDEEINDLMISLMNTLVNYKKSYNPNTYGYRTMNSLLDIVKETFVEINS